MHCKSVLVLHLVTALNIIFSSVSSGAAAPGSSPKKAECAARVSACEVGDGVKRPVCGSDNQTYSTRCQLLRVQCSGYLVTVKHKGPCADAQPCFDSLNYARSLQRSAPDTGATFMPKCRADGTYAAVQCHPDTGCWCVNPMGKAIPNTSVRNGRPKCGTVGKSYTQRRSSTRGQRNRKSCTRADKRQFNANLIEIFSRDLERARGPAATAPETADKEERARSVAQWKFTEMDKDGSGTLQKPEYRGLRRILKKVVKPRQCAKTFARVCDMDHNELITKQEWTNCLTGDGLNYEEGGNTERDFVGRADHDYGEDVDTEPMSVLPGSLIKVQFPESEIPMERAEDIDSNDCLSDRKTVLDEQKNGDLLYVPECTTDGRYQRVQCYRSTGYCWCVHEDTGKPIPGSSVKDQHPKCESLPTLERPMKGCPEPMKTNFLRDLMTYFLSKMTASTNGTVAGSTDILKWQASREEQIATWTFVMLDKDKNKLLERREWKSFHALVSSSNQLKKCGRKLPRYCDVNHDRKISITEWLTCLNAQRGAGVSPTTDSSRTTSTSKRKGPNPLDSILKATTYDDLGKYSETRPSNHAERGEHRVRSHPPSSPRVLEGHQTRLAPPTPSPSSHAQV